MLAGSIALNVIFALALALTVLRAKGAIRREKLVTFSGVLHAIANSLATSDKGEELRLLSLGLSSIRGTMPSKEDLERLLTRAAFVGLMRQKGALADVAGEHTTALTLQAVSQSAELEEVSDYVLGALAGDIEDAEEPRDRYGDKRLAEAQMATEQRILAAYDASLTPASIKIFG